MLGMPATLARTAGAGRDELDSWIRGACNGGEKGARVALLVRFLYQTVAGCCTALSCLVLAVSFFAPRNRALVFVVQLTLCGAFFVLTKHLALFHEDSRHLKSAGLALLLNAAAMILQTLDFVWWDTTRHGGIRGCAVDLDCAIVASEPR